MAAVLSKIVGRCATGMKKLKSMKRTNSSLSNVPMTTTVTESEVYNLTLEDGTEAPITYILRGLYKLSVNDMLRSHIYFENQIKDHLKVIVTKGNQYEQEFAFKLLCQLSFNKAISHDIVKDKELCESLNAESTGYLADIKSTLLWNLKTNSEASEIPAATATAAAVAETAPKVEEAPKPGGVQVTEPSAKADAKQPNEPIIKPDQTKGPGHVMISYNSDSRDLCLKVKSELEAMGHMVCLY